MTLFDTPPMTSYWRSIVTMAYVVPFQRSLSKGQCQASSMDWVWFPI